MSDSYKLNRLTDCRWANLFEVRFKRKSQIEKSRTMCSRKGKPVQDTAKTAPLHLPG